MSQINGAMMQFFHWYIPNEASTYYGKAQTLSYQGKTPQPREAEVFSTYELRG